MATSPLASIPLPPLSPLVTILSNPLPPPPVTPFLNGPTLTSVDKLSRYLISHFMHFTQISINFHALTQKKMANHAIKLTFGGEAGRAHCS